MLQPSISFYFVLKFHSGPKKSAHSQINKKPFDGSYCFLSPWRGEENRDLRAIGAFSQKGPEASVVLGASNLGRFQTGLLSRFDRVVIHIYANRVKLLYVCRLLIYTYIYIPYIHSKFFATCNTCISAPS